MRALERYLQDCVAPRVALLETESPGESRQPWRAAAQVSLERYLQAPPPLRRFLGVPDLDRSSLGVSYAEDPLLEHSVNALADVLVDVLSERHEPDDQPCTDDDEPEARAPPPGRSLVRTATMSEREYLQQK